MTYSTFNPPIEELQKACLGSLPEEVIEGLRLFNAGKYFEAHEHLETAWRNEPGLIRELYRGILQAGIAYYHIERGNFDGATKLFASCLNWLNPYPDQCRGIQVGKLKQDVRIVQLSLQRLGREHISGFDARMFKPVNFHIEDSNE